MQRELNKFQKSRFFKVGAARRATETKLTFVYSKQKNTFFQGRGHPQGNGDKTDLRLLKKNTRFFEVEAARRATGTKLTFVYFKKITIFRGRNARRATRTKRTFVYFQDRDPPRPLTQQT